MKGDHKFGVCVSCRKDLTYPPIKMPVTRPEIDQETPLHYEVEWRTFCIDCLLGREGYAFRACVAHGIMDHDGSEWDKISGEELIEIMSKVTESGK